MPNPSPTPEDQRKDYRTPEAKKWSDDFIPPETCGDIDDVQNALEHLRDANSQLRHVAHLLRHRLNLTRAPAPSLSEVTILPWRWRADHNGTAVYLYGAGAPQPFARVDQYGTLQTRDQAASVAAFICAVANANQEGPDV